MHRFLYFTYFNDDCAQKLSVPLNANTFSFQYSMAHVMNIVFLLGPEHGNQMTTNNTSSEHNTEQEDNLTGIIIVIMILY